jgi:hypothetical protein
MDMTINQSRAEKVSLDINYFFRWIISEAYDPPSKNGYIFSLDLGGEDIHHSSVLDEEIGRSLA